MSKTKLSDIKDIYLVSKKHSDLRLIMHGIGFSPDEDGDLCMVKHSVELQNPKNRSNKDVELMEEIQSTAIGTPSNDLITILFKIGSASKRFILSVNGNYNAYNDNVGKFNKTKASKNLAKTVRLIRDTKYEKYANK